MHLSLKQHLPEYLKFMQIMLVNFLGSDGTSVFGASTGITAFDTFLVQETFFRKQRLPGERRPIKMFGVFFEGKVVSGPPHSDAGY